MQKQKVTERELARRMFSGSKDGGGSDDKKEKGQKKV